VYRADVSEFAYLQVVVYSKDVPDLLRLIVNKVCCYRMCSLTIECVLLPGLLSTRFAALVHTFICTLAYAHTPLMRFELGLL